MAVARSRVLGSLLHFSHFQVGDSAPRSRNHACTRRLAGALTAGSTSRLLSQLAVVARGRLARRGGGRGRRRALGRVEDEDAAGPDRVGDPPGAWRQGGRRGQQRRRQRRRRQRRRRRRRTPGAVHHREPVDLRGRRPRPRRPRRRRGHGAARRRRGVAAARGRGGDSGRVHGVPHGMARRGAAGELPRPQGAWFHVWCAAAVQPRSGWGVGATQRPSQARSGAVSRPEPWLHCRSRCRSRSRSRSLALPSLLPAPATAMHHRAPWPVLHTSPQRAARNTAPA
jgi:hypothetical protein